MKQYKFVKWTIVGVLFVLTTISGLCLYFSEKDKIGVPENKESSILEKKLKQKKDSIETSIENIERNFRDYNNKLSEIQKLINENECDTLFKDEVEKTIASLNQIILSKCKNEINKCKNEIGEINKKLESESKNDAKQDEDSLEQKDKPTFRVIIHLVVTVILFTAFLTLLILFSGVFKFFTRKKNDIDQVNNNNQKTDPMEHKNAAGTTFDSIESVKVVENIFNLEIPNPKLSYKVIKEQNIDEYTIIIRCTHDDAEIKYCIVPDTANVINYTSPIKVNRKCTLLVIAICGGIRSEQLNIVVGSDNEIEEQSPQDTTCGQEGRTNNNVKSETETNVPDKLNRIPEVAKTQDDRIRIFTSEANVLGISYQGDNHIKTKPVVPCQDCHSFTKVNEVWSIAIVSDGAGSKKNSNIGSKAVCVAFTSYLSYMLQKNRNFANGNIPNEKIWDLEFRSILNKFQDDIKNHKNFASFEFESLAATIVILAYSPNGYLFAHVGDGRAGVKVNGEWKSILTPHKGDEANQTIFSTTVEFINKPALMMSGVFVPETKVEECCVEAFVLMSDGCEDGAWVTYQKVDLPNGDFRVEDMNQPRPQILDELMSLIDFKDDQKTKLVEFITGYNKGFKTEGDDKTILIGRIK